MEVGWCVVGGGWSGGLVVEVANFN